jgi:CRP/FNR family transcriptional regulator
VQAKTYEPNKSIFRQGHTSELFGSIRSGWAYIYQTLTDGRRHVQGFLLPGDTVVLDLLLIGSNPVPFGVRALTETTVCWFPAEYMKRLTQEGDEQQQETELWTSYYLWTLNHRAATISQGNAMGSIAEFILELSNRARHRRLVKDDAIEFPPTQAIIADCLGLTAVHVNRVLAHLQRRGVLEIKDKWLRIFDANELARIAEEEH